jgi:hypothetical protein
VRINLPYIKDEEFVRDAESWIDETQSDIGIVLSNTLEEVLAAMKGG